jgi:hypothetical protein
VFRLHQHSIKIRVGQTDTLSDSLGIRQIHVGFEFCSRLSNHEVLAIRRRHFHCSSQQLSIQGQSFCSVGCGERHIITIYTRTGTVTNDGGCEGGWENTENGRDRYRTCCASEDDWCRCLIFCCVLSSIFVERRGPMPDSPAFWRERVP